MLPRHGIITSVSGAVGGKRSFPQRRTLYHQKALLLGGLVFVLSGAWVSLGVFVLNFILIL